MAMFGCEALAVGAWVHRLDALLLSGRRDGRTPCHVVTYAQTPSLPDRENALGDLPTSSLCLDIPCILGSVLFLVHGSNCDVTYV